MAGGKKSAKKLAQAKTALKERKKQRKTDSKRYEPLDDDVIQHMRQQLSLLGCKLYEVEADGNCLFRAISDQLHGDQYFHLDIRKRIVDYIEEKRADFEPFMEDEEKFDHYCKRMREDGTWGGNQELYAAARLFQVYIIIHQDNNARMVIECDNVKPRCVLHIAYHGTDHYDSVRSLQDPCDPETPPREIVLDCDGFRPQDLEQRWKWNSASTTGKDSNVETPLVPRIVPPSASDDSPPSAVSETDPDAVNTLTDRLGIVQLTSNSVPSSGVPLSKKAQRKLKKHQQITKSKRKI